MKIILMLEACGIVWDKEKRSGGYSAFTVLIHIIFLRRRIEGKQKDYSRKLVYLVVKIQRISLDRIYIRSFDSRHRVCKQIS